MKQWNRWKSSVNCWIQETKTDSVEENTNSPCNISFRDRKGNKQMGKRFLFNKSLKVTGTNLVNERSATLTLTQKDKFEFKLTPTAVKIFRMEKEQDELYIFNVHAPHLRKTSSQEQSSLTDGFYTFQHLKQMWLVSFFANIVKSLRYSSCFSISVFQKNVNFFPILVIEYLFMGILVFINVFWCLFRSIFRVFQGVKDYEKMECCCKGSSIFWSDGYVCSKIKKTFWSIPPFS